ncbi:MAG: transporter substrate-binding domain-containing protein [Chthoniobacter sp.]|nr:transporter substrate-binding domain-containing protein [Chthoniobacter sp.]
MKSFHRLTLLILFALVATTRAADKPLIVGMDLSYPPFETRDTTGAPTGVSVDLAHALGEFLHRPVQIENIPFAGLIPALKTSRIDLVLSSMTATPERALSIDFSDPYLKTGLCLLVGAKTDIQSIADVDRPGRSAAVVKGTTAHIYATQQLKKARLLVLDQPASCVLEVAQGKADAFLFDQLSTLQNWRKNPDTTRAILTPFQAEGWAIGLHKGNDALRTQVNAFLADYQAKGGFEKLGDKWLSEQKAEFQKLGVPFVF